MKTLRHSVRSGGIRRHQRASPKCGYELRNGVSQPRRQSQAKRRREINSARHRAQSGWHTRHGANRASGVSEANRYWFVMAHMTVFPGRACHQIRKSHWSSLIRRFGRDETGVYAVVTALAMPVLVGAVAFGTEEGLLLYKHRQLQHAADSSAITAAVGFAAGAGIVAQADSVAADSGFMTGSNSTITVHQPPTSGPNLNNPKAIEVIISQSQPPLFSSLLGKDLLLD